MFEPIFTPHSEAARQIHGTSQAARDAALVFRANSLAIESAFRFGTDFPCGAVAATGQLIVGRSIANDTRFGFKQMHAEYMAIMDSQVGTMRVAPDTIAVSLEPCASCQDYLATQPSIKRVVFPLVRKDASDRGLVNAKDETIFERAERIGLPYEIVHLEDEQLRYVGGLLLDQVQRNSSTGAVRINTTGLNQALTLFNQV